MAMRKCDDGLVYPNAAGIDVGGSSHWVAVPRRTCDDPVREFGAMTDDLNAMAEWLLACSVDTVALESTGVYWIRSPDRRDLGASVWAAQHHRRCGCWRVLRGERASRRSASAP